MGEVVNVLVAFAVIIFLFRWVTSGSDNVTEHAAALGFRPKQVSQDMITTVSNMFPDIPIPNIHYDLLRTGSVEQTTNKVLERGFLEAPPTAFHALYPQSSASASSTSHLNGSTTRTASSSSSGSKPAAKTSSLIERYQLAERVKSGDVVEEEDVGGKAQWEDTASKREASLKERKAQMILAARQRFLAQQAANGVKS